MNSISRWADQCSDDHDKNRKVPEFGYVGQNLASGSFTANVIDKDLEARVQMWYDEVIV